MEEMNWKMREHIERLEGLRKESSDNRDAGDYFRYCNELGIEPEVFDLYESGEAESNRGKLEKSVGGKRKRTVSDFVYNKFYQEAKNFSFNIGTSTMDKTELLIKYFPGRFGDKGRTPICNMDYLSLGSLFNKMINYSLKRINQ